MWRENIGIFTSRWNLKLPLELLLFEMSETLIVASACREILFSKTAQTYFRLRSACGSQIERNSTFNFCRIKMKIKPWRLSKQLENQLDSVTENPFGSAHVTGQNTHSRNIFSVQGFLRLSVRCPHTRGHVAGKRRSNMQLGTKIACCSH